MSDDLRNRVARAIQAAFAEHTEIASLSDAVADAMADAALAEIGGVRVKPLTFRTVADGRMALSPVGPYRVLEQSDGFFDVMFDGCLVNQRKKGQAFKSYEAAEAWAQTRHQKQVTECLAAIEPAPHHPDDLAVDRFAAAMKEKLRYSREVKNRGGWECKDEVPASYLSRLLREHVDKGDPLDVGNLAMMLHQRGDSIEPAPVSVREAARVLLDAWRNSQTIDADEKAQDYADIHECDVDAGRILEPWLRAIAEGKE